MTKRTITTTNGKQMTVIGVHRSVIDGILNSAKYPSKPTYKAVTAAGVEEEHPLDEESISTDEEREAWEAYKAEYSKVDKQVFRHIMDAFLLVGVEVDMSGMDDWLKLQSFLGIIIPDNEFERKRMYIEATYLPTDEDLVNLTAELMSLSGADRKAVNDAKDSFRDKKQGDTIERPKKNGRNMASKRNVQLGGSGI